MATKRLPKHRSIGHAPVMFWALKNFWKSIGVFLTLFGILYLPADILSSTEAMSGWRRVFAMVDRQTALVSFSTMLVIYIVWIDARPLVAGWRNRRKTGLKVWPQISWRSGISDEIDGETYFKNVAALVVHNDSTDGRTIYGVKVRAGTFELLELTDRITSKTQVDIQSGEHAEFVLGSVTATRMFGTPDNSIKMTEIDVLYARHNVGQGHRTLRTDMSGLVLMIGAPHEGAPPTRKLEMPRIRVTAKDLPPQNVQLTINPRSMTSAEHVDEAPLIAEVVV